MRVHYDTKIPIFLQIIRKIKLDIFHGVYKSGDKVPSIHEMNEIMDVNPNTIVRVYSELDREGLLESRRGSGYFVAASEEDIARLRLEMADNAAESAVKKFRELKFSDDEIRAAIDTYLKKTKENN